MSAYFFSQIMQRRIRSGRRRLLCRHAYHGFLSLYSLLPKGIEVDGYSILQ